MESSDASGGWASWCYKKRCPSHRLQIELVDFGATREYSKEFMDNWARLLGAAAADDRQGCVEWSLKLGYLTGEENEVRGRLLLAGAVPCLFA